MGYSEDLDSAEIAEKLHEQVRANDILNRNLVRREEEIAKYYRKTTLRLSQRKPTGKKTEG